ncbi:hypothetical protein SAMN06265171_102424 [Chryseobacterium rhizoplanae]|uniref:Uncharacterized protein n=1 Tax=Chryseobacterium rhizoplanae TaxID=1609531 RepID=A0A521C408_9FLAO|nr:hypothetical protein [Chryseobacterium rhizoplanae]SMO54133.1 hypothetical protein SAMN06265171_102424 [Chryseobacterium rhizoplanae]
MKQKKKLFEQHIYHEIDDEEKADEYLENSLPLIGLIVMYFNGLEKSLDSIICKIFTDRSDSTGLIVLHKMSYATKVDLFKRFSEDFHFACDVKIEGYQTLIANLRESGRLRNLVVHADWENTDNDGYTYINLKISSNGMEQEYLQFSVDSLKEIIDLIITSRNELQEYWDKRNEKLYK